MLGWIGAIIIGFFAGLIARAIKPGDDKMGLIMTSVLGIAGSLLATFLGQAVGWYKPGQSAGFIMSVIGAIVVLVIYGMVAKGKGGNSGGGDAG
jgi:uncharacterized membrane protein YeaQ/YmgE (transglycosylase-associated protein family)